MNVFSEWRYDLLTLGETLMRLSPPADQRLAQARLGLMFYEPGPEPRTGRVIYDRKHSAASELAFEDAPWDALVQASAWLHLSGITPVLGPSCRALILQLAALAAS